MKSPDLRLPLKKCDRGKFSDFSFESLWSDVTSVAPTFFHNLALSDQASVEDNVQEVLNLAEDDWINDDGLLDPETDGGQSEIIERQVNVPKEPRRNAGAKMAVISILSSLYYTRHHSQKMLKS